MQRCAYSCCSWYVLVVNTIYIHIYTYVFISVGTYLWIGAPGNVYACLGYARSSTIPETFDVFGDYFTLLEFSFWISVLGFKIPCYFVRLQG